MSFRPVSASTISQEKISTHSDTKPPSSGYLDWTQRPDSLKVVISSAFKKIVDNSSSLWGVYNGSSNYSMCGVHEQALMKKTVQQAYPDRKDFYALDIGPGNFQWSRGMADFINNQADLPKDITVHIVGIRGESYFGDRTIEIDRCKIYNLGAFKVEELFKEFKERGFDFEGKIDLAISRWCIRHLADPVGTFVQVYNSLQPGTGFFLVDGFYFLPEKEILEKVNPNLLMTKLFMDTKAPFLTQSNDNLRSLNHFILRRPDESPCQLPMSYANLSYVGGDAWQIGSGYVTHFKMDNQNTSDEIHLPDNSPNKAHDIYGDKKTYDWLKKNELLIHPHTVWNALRAKDIPLGTTSLHLAVMKGEGDKIEARLHAGDDIDVSDGEGRTALHIAIEMKSFDSFSLLLSKGANFKLSNGKSHTPLHEACIHDTEGRFVQALIDAGAQINVKSYYWKTPLDCAIEAKNPKAVELLIKAGAEVSVSNYNELEDVVFSSLDEQDIIPVKRTGKGALADIHSWIARGDCIVLHSDGYNGIQYYYPKASNKYPKLLIVNVKPESNLLNDSEWPEFLKVAGYDCKPYDEEEIKKAGCKFQKQFNFP